MISEASRDTDPHITLREQTVPNFYGSCDVTIISKPAMILYTFHTTLLKTIYLESRHIQFMLHSLMLPKRK